MNEERLRKKAQVTAEAVLDGHLESGEVAEVEDWLNDSENAGVLDTKSRRWYRNRIKEGGGLGQSVTNTDTYIALFGMTSMDIDDLRAVEAEDMPSGRELGREEILADRINEAYRDNRLSRNDWEKLIEASEEHRFGQAQKYLKNSLTAGTLSGGEGAALSRIKAQEAMAEFTNWRVMPENRNASRRDAMVIARGLVEDAAFLNRKTNESFDLDESPYFVRDEATQSLNEKATMDALVKALNRGGADGIDRQQFDYQVFRLTSEAKQEQVPNE
jgi:hypothetical protein